MKNQKQCDLKALSYPKKNASVNKRIAQDNWFGVELVE